jgi:crossover junction endodeoxyribonuclease RuvC
VDSGCIRLRGEDLVVRLGRIFDQVSELVETHRPDVLAIEQVFVSRNPSSALKLGQARGAAICAGVRGGCPLPEYSPTSIKQAVVGTGCRQQGTGAAHDHHDPGAQEHTHRHDAADALAVALCHAHTQATLSQMPEGLQRPPSAPGAPVRRRRR